MKRLVRGPQVVAFVDGINGGTRDEGANGIGLEEHGRIIAGVKYDGWNGASICMHVAADPGRRWMTRELLHAAFDFPFNQLRVRKILGTVVSTNRGAIDFDLHLGFVPEATLKDAAPGGDIVVMSMTRQQCRFLKD